MQRGNDATSTEPPALQKLRRVWLYVCDEMRACEQVQVEHIVDGGVTTDSTAIGDETGGSEATEHSAAATAEAQKRAAASARLEREQKVLDETLSDRTMLRFMRWDAGQARHVMMKALPEEDPGKPAAATEDELQTLPALKDKAIVFGPAVPSVVVGSTVSHAEREHGKDQAQPSFGVTSHAEGDDDGKHSGFSFGASSSSGFSFGASPVEAEKEQPKQERTDEKQEPSPGENDKNDKHDDGSVLHHEDAATRQAREDDCLLAGGVFYFEVAVIKPGKDNVCCVGILPKAAAPSYRDHLGWKAGSVAYHGDDGQFYNSDLEHGAAFGEDAVVGCGWDR